MTAITAIFVFFLYVALFISLVVIIFTLIFYIPIYLAKLTLALIKFCYAYLVMKLTHKRIEVKNERNVLKEVSRILNE